MAENMIVFDSLSYANKLEEVGFTREQAEVQATILTDYLDSTLVSKKDMVNSTNDLKRDIEGVRAELKRDIAETHVKIEACRTELKRDIEQLGDRMIIKLGSIMVVGIAAMVAIQKLL